VSTPSKTKPAKASQVEMTELVLPHHANAIGSVFGGTVMAWVDTAAAACGMRHANRQVVTAAVDAMHFHAPIKLGWIVTVKASINCTSKTSCEVGVKIIAENPISQERHHTASAYVTMVAVDSFGKPTSMTQVVAESTDQKRRMAAAQKRREMRLVLREQQSRENS
jgi:acyl-CoA hydrolase